MSIRDFNRITASMAGVALLAGMAVAQDDSNAKRGRKYKAPPATAHVEVLVERANDGKPLANAAVIFHPVKDGKDAGNLELKSDSEGKAVIDLIPIGSHLRVQVIANGYASYGEDYDVPGDSKEIVVKMKRPVGQVSTYRENSEQPNATGVQEPVRPTTKPMPPTPGVLPVTPEPQKTTPQ